MKFDFVFAFSVLVLGEEREYDVNFKRRITF